MAYGQDSDVAVDADLLRRLDVSPVSGPRANMLQALELLFGERLFEDAKTTVTKDGYPKKSVLLRMFGITDNQGTYWLDERRSRKISTKEMSELIKDNKNFKKIPVEDLAALFGTDGPVLVKAKTAPTEKLFAALGLLLTESLKLRRTLQGKVSGKPAARQIDDQAREQHGSQKRQDNSKSSRNGSNSQDVENLRKLAEAIQRAIRKLSEIAKCREQGDAAAGGEGDQEVAGAGEGREQSWRNACRICVGKDCTVRAMCGCCFCIPCYETWITGARAEYAGSRLYECKLCPKRHEAFQAVEVGMHVTFQPEWHDRYMPPIQKVDYDVAMTENFLPASTTEESVKEWNRCLNTLRRAVLKHLIRRSVETEEALEQALKDGNSRSERSVVMQAILKTHIAWKCFLLKDIQGAIHMQERAVRLFEEACSHEPNQEPTDRLPDTLGRYWGTTESTLAMLVFRDNGTKGPHRFEAARDLHEKTRKIFLHAHYRIGEANAHGNIAAMNYCIGAEKAKPKVGEDKVEVTEYFEAACRSYQMQIEKYLMINADQSGTPLIAQEQLDAVKLNLFCLHKILGQKELARAALRLDDSPKDAKEVHNLLLELPLHTVDVVYHVHEEQEAGARVDRGSTVDVHAFGVSTEVEVPHAFSIAAASENLAPQGAATAEMDPERTIMGVVQPAGAHEESQEPFIQILGDVANYGAFSLDAAIDLYIAENALDGGNS